MVCVVPDWSLPYKKWFQIVVFAVSDCFSVVSDVVSAPLGGVFMVKHQCRKISHHYDSVEINSE